MKRACILWVTLFLIAIQGAAQVKQDTSRNNLIDRLKEKDVAQKALKSIVRKPEADTVFHYRSEDAFIPYSGKIIRRIHVETIHLTGSVQDTSKVIQNKLSRIGEGLHTDTKEQVIRNNLFIKEGQQLNPYRVADNERYLRDLNFIKDSRIFVVPIKGTDSVDLRVMTRDVFSIGASLDPDSPTSAGWLIQDANLFGSGLRIAYAGQYDSDRDPQFGFNNTIRQNSVLGSFVDATLGHTVINTGRSLGNENETAFYLRLDRPLFMPYARWAGGVELSRNWSQNVFEKPDSLYASYIYSIQDYWAGVTFGVNRNQRPGRENRNRKFLAARVLDQHFIRQPGIELSERDQLLYTNRHLNLIQFTLFRQNFYKTKYVYGFGRTEDVPYGYSVSFTTGLERQASIERPYVGADVRKSFTDRGSIISLEAQGGGYFRNGESEDMKVNLNVSYFSKVIPMKSFDMRYMLELGVSRFYNRNIKSQLDINGLAGIQGFQADSLFGNTRLRTRMQSIVFTNWRLLGFNFAVVPQLDLAFLSRSDESALNGRFFQGLSLGIRTRNENLIFNTFEVRGFFYPTTVEGLDHLGISVNASLRIKYPTNLVRPPETIFDL